MKHTTKRIFSIILILILMLGTISSSFAEEIPSETGESSIAEGETDGNTSSKDSEAKPKSVKRTTIHIASKDDFVAFAKNCQRKMYSENMTVLLDCDLDFTGEAVDSIPSFSGIFQGQDHYITGITLSGNGSHQGLFRYVMDDGKIYGLNVSGTVTPNGSRAAVGGIVGTNYGVIKDCKFSGTVEALLNVGGIAGENYGIVARCESEGFVNGKHFTGGIVGYNEGSVVGCKNSASVNTEIMVEALDIDSLDLKSVLGINFVSSEDSDSVSDSGGITGINTGSVTSCKNFGEIGYQRYGYNVGGISGRQSGYIAQCENSGTVLGRNDVGGIVGQMEPFLILADKESLSEEILKMQESTDLTLENLDKNSSELGSNISDANAAGLQVSSNYYDTEGAIDTAVSDPTEFFSTEEDDGGQSRFGKWIIEKEDTVTSYTDTIGTDTIESFINGDGLTDENAEGITNVSERGAEDLIGDGGTVDKVKSRKEERDAEEEAAQKQKEEDLVGAVESGRDVGDSFSNTMSILSADLSEVNAHYGKVMTMIANALSGNYELTVLNDISEDDEDGMKDGKVERCRNTGNIFGETNIGGVAGNMGVEVDFDLEGLLSGTITDTIEISTEKYDSRCILTNCINDAAVEAKKSTAGGIAGLSDMGTITFSQNYGKVMSSGEYAGGVVGESKSSVKKSFSMCDLSGSEYVGGIAGSGVVIENCSSIITADRNTACTGAIAGWVDFSSENTRIGNNYFVNEDLGGIDGISYDEKCDRVSYDELLTLKSLPERFRNLRLTFVANGQVVKVLEFEYGQSIDQSDIPEVPKVEGSNGFWPDRSYENLTRDDTIEAVYVNTTSILAGNEKRPGEAMSIVLADGCFPYGATINAKQLPDDGEYGKNVKEVWDVSIENCNLDIDNYNLRWNYGKRNNLGVKNPIFVAKNGAWEKVDTSVKGSYYSFPVNGNHVTFCVMEPDYTAITLICVAAGVVIIAFAAWSIYKKKKN